MKARSILLLGILSFGPASATGGPQLKGWHYAITVDPALATLTSTVCFDGPVPKILVPGDESAIPYVFDAVALGGQRRPLLRTGDGLAVPVRRGVEAPPCVRYRVRLNEAIKARDMDVAVAIGRDIVFSPDLWLWQPSELPASHDVTAGFRLPPGIAVSVPWERLPPSHGEEERFRISDSTFAWQTAMALGRFQVEQVVVKGSTLSVARLDGPMRASPEGVLRWIREAARAVTTLYGVFPFERVQILVKPSRGSGLVDYGMVERGGGPTAIFYVSARAKDQDLPGEWIAVHELSHIALPFVERDDAWLSEGFATYYQNVVRSRAGLMSEEEAWQSLHEGFKRGIANETGRSLAATSARMGRDHDFMRVYWGGAAIALLADVELRKRSSDPSSLDAGLLELRGCCLHESRRFSAKEIFARLDRATRGQVFRELYQRHTPSETFPDLRATYPALGLVVEGDQIRLDDRAPLAPLRRAIMAKRRD